MLGTVILFNQAAGTGLIQADGFFYDRFDPRWILQPAPRDGVYSFSGSQLFFCWAAGNLHTAAGRDLAGRHV
jgi:hypothetical protein